MQWRLRSIALLVLFATFGFGSVHAQAAIQPTVDITKVPAAAQPSAHFNADAATEAYMAMIPPAARPAPTPTLRAATGCSVGFSVCLGRLPAAVESALVGAHARPGRAHHALQWLQTFLYWVQYLVLTTVLGFPLEFYEGYIREHKYGLATQTFGPWMGDEGKALLVNLVLGGIFVVVLFAIVRKLREHLVDLGLDRHHGVPAW